MPIDVREPKGTIRVSHIALYRAWRPQTFQDMVGQQHIVQTLQNAIREQRVYHAYLFNGPRGTGKTTAAKIMAKAINCERGPAVEPCNECDACRGITAERLWMLSKWMLLPIEGSTRYVI